MLTSLALIFLAGLAMAAICQQLRLPRIIGMLATGILLGPYALNLLDESILSISADLRQMALIIILLKAGLSLDLDDLRRVGRPAILMSFVPASCEILGFLLLAPRLLHISLVEAAVMGSVLAAVSEGSTVIVENIFETRFKHLAELTKMGVSVKVKGRVAVFEGVKSLSAAEVQAMDLRGGAALMIAGLKASGTTVVENGHHIERGYAAPEEVLNALGASVIKV